MIDVQVEQAVRFPAQLLLDSVLLGQEELVEDFFQEDRKEMQILAREGDLARGHK